MPLSHRKLTYRSPAAVLLFFLILLIARLAMGGGAVNAQTASPTPAPVPSPQLTDVTRPAPAPAPSPKVAAIDGHLELDTIVGVEVEHFSEWAATHDPTKLVPFINGRAVRGNYPEEIHPDRNRLHFHLEIKPQNKELWTDLLGAPQGLRHPVTFTVGLENESPFDSVFNQSQPLPLTVISPVYGVICLLVILFTLALFVWLTRTTNLIREPGLAVPGKLRPYNLGRTQMAFWFFLVYVSYTVIWLITDSLDTITPSLLGLMGISAGTALGEALIDSGKDKANSSQLQELISEKQAPTFSGTAAATAFIAFRFSRGRSCWESFSCRPSTTI